MSISAQPVIKCESVYKIFGENAKKILKQAGGKVDSESLLKAGCAIGVNNASVKVNRGEILVVISL